MRNCALPNCFCRHRSSKSMSCLNRTIRSSFSKIFWLQSGGMHSCRLEFSNSMKAWVVGLEIRIASSTFASTFSSLMMTHENSFTSAPFEISMSPVAIARVPLWTSLVVRVVVEVLVLLSNALSRDCIVPSVLRHTSVVIRFFEKRLWLSTFIAVNADWTLCATSS